MPRTDPEFRLPAIRVTDVILATLQAAFSQDVLIEGANPYRFNRDDPKNSRVWVCDPDSRVDANERDGQRMVVMVSRGSYQPGETSMHNYAGGTFSGEQNFTDIAYAPIYIQCEAGNKVSSEVLASISYQILKLFRRRIMADYDLNNLKLLEISAPTKIGDATGEPWVTTVTARVEIQEHAQLTELSNRLNHVAIEASLEALTASRTITVASLDT